MIFLFHLRAPDTGGKENSKALANGEGSPKIPLRKTAINPFLTKEYLDKKKEESQKDAKEEKISLDFLSSALPVISASVEELSWFGRPPKSNYPEFRFQLK